MKVEDLKLIKQIGEMWDIAITQDQELYDGMLWCEEQAKKRGVEYHEFIKQLLARHDAKKWLQERQKKVCDDNER